MIVTPKETPILANLNSYYVRIRRLIEHFQGEVGCGVLHFRSYATEGILYFDKDEVLNGVFQSKAEHASGAATVNTLIQSAESTNYNLSIYKVRPEDIYFWSTLPDAKRIYQDLSTEFTDLEGLIKKMENEELTGFVETLIGKTGDSGLIFFNHGRVCGGSFSWGAGDSVRGAQDRDQLVKLTRDHGGIFHVSRMAPGNQTRVAAAASVMAKTEQPSARTIGALEELMVIFERTVMTQKNRNDDFATLLNRKLVEKADRYPFLDPFAAEFRYVDKRIDFSGTTTDGELIQGIVESITEIAQELEAMPQFRGNLDTWIKKYESEVATLDLTI
jgi:hypothetical protein